MVSKAHREQSLSHLGCGACRTALRPIALAMLLAFGHEAHALPADPKVIAGHATVSTSGSSNLVVHQTTSKAAVDWRTFSVAPSESVRFDQPSASAMTVNRVTSNDPSRILGQISAPGSVFLINPAGVTFGRSAVVHVGNLIATTLTANPLDLLNGRMVFSAAPGGSGAVRNEGRITTPQGGSVSLIGAQVSNSGSISTPGGTTGMIAGEKVTVDFHGDGIMRYEVDVAAARALVEQTGHIDADGGRVAMQASARDALLATVLNVEGVVRARGASVRNGEIYLDGGSSGVVSVSGQVDASGPDAGHSGGDVRVLGDKVALLGEARIDASGAAGGGTVLIGGDYQGKGKERNAQQTYVGRDAVIAADAGASGDGGKVIAWADDWTRFYGSISARGGEKQGDGGFVEVSGKQNLAFDGQVVTSAPHGKAGSLLLDPGDLYLVATAPTSPPHPASTELPGQQDPATQAWKFSNKSDDPYYVVVGGFNNTDTDFQLEASKNVILETDVGFGSTLTRLVSISAVNTIQTAWQTQTDSGNYAISTAGGNLTLKAETMVLGSITTGNTPGQLVIDIGQGGATQGAGTITANNLEKRGSGQLTLDKANTLTGTTEVVTGILAVSNSGGLGLSHVSVNSNAFLQIQGIQAAVTVANGVTLDGGVLQAAGNARVDGQVTQTADKASTLSAPGAVPGTPASALTLGTGFSGGGGTSSLNIVGGGSVVLAGDVDIGGSLVQDASSKLVLGAGQTVSSAGNQVYKGTVEGLGVATLTSKEGLNIATILTPAGDLTLKAKSMELGNINLKNATNNNVGDLSIDTIDSQAAAIQANGTISARNLTKRGPGQLTLSEANTLTGTTRADGGTLAVSNAGGLGLSHVSVNSNAFLQIQGIQAAVTVANGVTLDGGVLQAAGNARVDGQVTQTADKASTLSAPGAVPGTPASALTLGTGFSGGGGTSSLNIVGGGSVVLAGDVDIGGSLVQDASSKLVLGAGQTVSSAGNQVYKGTVEGLGVATLTSKEGLNIATILTPAGDLTLKAKSMELGNINLKNATNNNVGDLSIDTIDSQAAAIQANGTISARNLTKRGPGQLTLSEANTLTGTTRIEDGTLTVGDATALGTGNVTVSSSGNAAGRLNIANVTLTLGVSQLEILGDGPGGQGALTGSGVNAGYDGTVKLSGNASVGAQTSSDFLILPGAIVGTDRLTKVGAGTVVLSNSSNSNSYSGDTTVSGGTLVVAKPDALGAKPVTVGGGATLELKDLVFTNDVNLDGGTLQADGTVVMKGAVSQSATSADKKWALEALSGSNLELKLPLGGGASTSALKINGAGVVALAGGADIFGSLVQEAASTLILGAGKQVSSTGSQSYAGIVTGTSVSLLASRGAKGITAVNAENDFIGVLTLTADQAEIRDRNDLDIQAANVSGTLTTTTLGRTTLAGQVGDLNIAQAGSTDFGPTTVARTARIVSGGAVTQSGALNVTGTTALDAAGQVVTLTHVDNDFVGQLTLTADQAEIRDRNALDIQAANVSGTLTTTTPGRTTLAGQVGDLNIAQAGSTDFGPTTVARTARIVSGGAVTQSGALNVTGTTALDAAGQVVTLTHVDNDFVGQLTLTADQAEIRDRNALDIQAANVSGTLTTTTLGRTTLAGQVGDLNIAQAGSTDFGPTTVARTARIVSGGAVTQSGALNVTGTTALDAAGQVVTLTHVDNDFVGQLTLTADQAEIRDRNDLDIQAANVSGTLTTTTPGRTTLAGQVGDLNIAQAGSTDFGPTTVARTARIVSGGAVTQSGALNVTGTTALDAAGQVVTLTHVDNDFVGQLTLTADQAEIRDRNALDIQAANVSGTLTTTTLGRTTLAGQVGDLNIAQAGSTDFGPTTVARTARIVSGGAVTQSGALNVMGTTALDAAGQVVTLTHVDNDFVGQLTLTADQAEIRDRNDLDIQAANVSGTLTTTTPGRTTLAGQVGDLNIAQAGSTDFGPTTVARTARIVSGGAVTQSGALNVTGTTALDAAGQVVTLTHVDNDFVGQLTLTADQAEIRDRNDLDIQAANVSGTLTTTTLGRTTLAGQVGDLNIAQAGSTDFGPTTVARTARIVSGGAVTQSGALNVMGTTALDAAGQVVTLTHVDNDFVGQLTLTADQAEIRDRNDLDIQAANVSGTLTTTTPGRTTLAGQVGDLNIAQAGSTDFGPTTVARTARIVSGGVVTQSGALNVTGTTALDAAGQVVTLTHVDNDFVGQLTLTADQAEIRDRNALDIQAANVSGTLTTTTPGRTTLAGQVGDLNIAQAGSTDFGPTTVARTARIVSGGAVTQSGALNVTGTTALDAAGQVVTLTHVDNDFVGQLTLTADQAEIRDRNDLDIQAANVSGTLTTTTLGRTTLAGQVGDLNIAQAGSTDFGPTTVARTARIVSGGAVTQSGALNVMGTTALDAAGQVVTLTHVDNDFVGQLTLTADQAEIRDRNDLDIQAANVSGTLTTTTPGRTTLAGQVGDLNIAQAGSTDFGPTTVARTARIVSGGVVTQSGALNVTGTTALDAAGQVVTLTHVDNDFVGQLTLTADQAEIRDRNDLDIQAANVSGTLTTTTPGRTTLAGQVGDLNIAQAGSTDFGPTTVARTARIVSGGAVTQSGALNVTGTTALDAAGQVVTLTHVDNDFVGQLTLTADQAEIRDRNALDIQAANVSGTLTTTTPGRTTLAGQVGDLNIAQAGSTDFGPTTVARTARIVSGGAVTQSGALNVMGTTTLDAAGQVVTLTHVDNDFIGPLEITASQAALTDRNDLAVVADNVKGTLTTNSLGTTTLSGKIGDLNVAQSGGTRFGLATVDRNARIFSLGPVSQTGALNVMGTTSLSAAGQAVTLARADNDFVGQLTLTAGQTTIRDANTLEVVLNTGSTILDAGNTLKISGAVVSSPSSSSRWSSATTVELGELAVGGAGTVEIVSSADMPVQRVDGVSVQDRGGTPRDLDIYESSIFQKVGTVISTGQGVTLRLMAEHASIDLTAGARVGEENNQQAGLVSLVEAFSVPDANKTLAHPDQRTNQLRGPVSAFSAVDAEQAGGKKSVIAIASDTLDIAPNTQVSGAGYTTAIDADSVILLARRINGGGGNIQTHVAASQLRNGRNIATDPAARDDASFSILPSIFLIADAPAGSSDFSFGSLGLPIAVGFDEGILQTIAAYPYENVGAAGQVPIYLSTQAPGGRDPVGVIQRFVVRPANLDIRTIRSVVVDGSDIADSSAYNAVKQTIAETLNQVRGEQLESGFSNENVAAQLRKGVITETRVGQAAIDEFQGVAAAESCAGSTEHGSIACSPGAAPRE